MVLPIHDVNPVRRTPVITYLLIAINVVAFLVSPVSHAFTDGAQAHQCQVLEFFDHYAAQDRVPEVGARSTGGYTLWNAALAYRMKVQATDFTWYARLDNLTNRLAYSATSILTTTVYPAAPLPGRSLKVGLRVTF